MSESEFEAEVVKAEAAAEPTNEESALEEPDEEGRTSGGMAFVSGGDSVM